MRNLNSGATALKRLRRGTSHLADRRHRDRQGVGHLSAAEGRGGGEVAEAFVQMGEDQLAESGRLQALAAADEYGLAQLGFRLQHLLADGPQRHAELLGGGSEAAQAASGLHRPQGVHLQPGQILHIENL